MSIKQRITRLEKVKLAREPNEPNKIEVFWGDEITDEDGQVYTFDEWKELHKDDPDFLWVTWDDIVD